MRAVYDAGENRAIMRRYEGEGKSIRTLCAVKANGKEILKTISPKVSCFDKFNYYGPDNGALIK